MSFADIIRKSPLGSFGKGIREAPREIILSPYLLLSSLLYALSAMPVSWDQGSSSVVPSLPGFQQHFKISSGANAAEISTFISIIYVGYGVGAALSFFINDRIGRLWSFRLYMSVWALGSVIAVFSPNLPALYAARVVQGLGIGPLTVIGPMAIVEIAPAEIRGLLAGWFTVMMCLAGFVSIFCVYGILLHVAPSRLQYQIVWFVPPIFAAVCILISFFLAESPRWMMLRGRRDDALKELARLRRMAADDPRVLAEITDIENDINKTTEAIGNTSFWGIVKETFTVAANLRRVQQTFVSYALAQLSGANLITSYFVPILSLIGASNDRMDSVFLSGMYTFSKFWFILIASFLLIDTLGRRRSLFLGAGLQMVTHVYLAVYVRYLRRGPVPQAASEGAIAALFIHAFGYAVGLFVLPYVFGGELWPNRIRSFGGAISQAFHWLFIYAMQFSMPSILSTFDTWGAFVFFGAWCAVAIVYVFFMVPEVAGLSVEEIDDLFKGPWFNAYKGVDTKRHRVTEAEEGSYHKNDSTPLELDEDGKLSKN